MKNASQSSPPPSSSDPRNSTPTRSNTSKSISIPKPANRSKSQTKQQLVPVTTPTNDDLGDTLTRQSPPLPPIDNVDEVAMLTDNTATQDENDELVKYTRKTKQQ